MNVQFWRNLLASAMLACIAAAGVAQEKSVTLEPAAAGINPKERRIALVIGNSAYKSSPLKNPVNDARAMGKALAETGFKVEVIENASQSTMRRAVRKFGDEIAAGGVGLFYFAGHGMQVKGRNFLIPVNAEIEREDEIEDQAVDAQLVLGKMETAKNQLNLMILDACRNNPFARSFRSAASGLAQMDAPSGTLVAFATAPGSVASDGAGDNGLYTQHLLETIRQPGLPVEQVFKRVRIGVTKDTQDKQVPWESSSLRGEFFFRAGTVVDVAAMEAERKRQDAVIQAAVQEALKRNQPDSDRAKREEAERLRLEEALRQSQAERERMIKQRQEEQERFDREKQTAKVDVGALELAFWDSIKAGGMEADYQAYIRRFPNGVFVELARNRIKTLQTPAPVVASAPPQVAAAPVVSIAAVRPAQAPASPTGNAPTPALAPAEPSAATATPFSKPIAGTQLASIAPGTAVLSATPRDLPKPGDQWNYIYKDTFKKIEYSVQMAAMVDGGVVDRLFVNGGLQSETTYQNEYAIKSRSLGSAVFGEFSPYWKLLDPNENPKLNTWQTKNQFGNVNHKFEIADEASVRVPGGEFKARVGVISTQGIEFEGAGRQAMVRTECRVWFVSEIKRFVKMECRGLDGANRLAAFSVELSSFKLQ